MVFNDAIGHLGLVELPLKGRAFTWSNMQANPLLEQLDWFFTSVNWTTSFPNTQVVPLAKITSDHIPCNVVIDTKIPKATIFRFESFWAEMAGFQDIIQRVLGTSFQSYQCSHLIRFGQTVIYSHRHPKILGLSIPHS
jgi:hypothetical protein